MSKLFSRAFLPIVFLFALATPLTWHRFLLAQISKLRQQITLLVNDPFRSA